MNRYDWQNLIFCPGIIILTGYAFSTAEEFPYLMGFFFLMYVFIMMITISTGLAQSLAKCMDKKTVNMDLVDRTMFHLQYIRLGWYGCFFTSLIFSIGITPSLPITIEQIDADKWRIAWEVFILTSFIITVYTRYFIGRMIHFC